MAELGQSTFYGNAVAAIRDVLRGGKRNSAVLIRPDPSEAYRPQPIPITYGAVLVNRGEGQTVPEMRVGGLKAILYALTPPNVYTTDMGAPSAGVAMPAGTTAVGQTSIMSAPEIQTQQGVTRVQPVSVTPINQPGTHSDWQKAPEPARRSWRQPGSTFNIPFLSKARLGNIGKGL